MRIRLRIDRLVLDGTPFAEWRPAELQAQLAADLEVALAGAGLRWPEHDVAVRRIVAAEPAIAGEPLPQFSANVARTVGAAIRTAGEP